MYKGAYQMYFCLIVAAYWQFFLFIWYKPLRTMDFASYRQALDISDWLGG